MVLTGNYITSFFEDGNQMGLANRTRIFLQEEGITTVGDLVEFTEDKIWLQVIDNCKSYPQVSPEGVGALIPQKPFRIAEKMLMCLKVNAVLISYYDCTSIPLTVGNIEKYRRIKNFSLQWKSTQDPKKNDNATLTKQLKTVSN